MKRKSYDMTMLSETGMFDTNVSTMFYYSTRDYFDALTDFVQHYKRDLANYNPAFVVNSADSREDFIRECFEVRAILVRLGMNELLDALSTLENAAITKHDKEFSDGQIKFRATIEIYKKTIKEAVKK